MAAARRFSSQTSRGKSIFGKRATRGRSPSCYCEASYSTRVVETLHMDRLVSFQPGKAFDGFPGLLLGQAQVIESLQVEPKLRARAKEMSEAQGGVAGDGARAIQDLRDAIGRHSNLAR